MAVNLSPFAGVGAQLFDNNGNVLAGGKIYSYAAGTSTPQTTYTTSAGNIAQPNPIVLDSTGRVPGGEIWLSFNALYKFVLNDASGNLIGSYDNIGGISNGLNVQDFTGDGTTTSFALSGGVTSVYNIYINGIYQNKNTYSVTAGSIVFTQAPPYNSKIEAQV